MALFERVQKIPDWEGKEDARLSGRALSELRLRQLTRRASLNHGTRGGCDVSARSTSKSRRVWFRNNRSCRCGQDPPRAIAAVNPAEPHAGRSAVSHAHLLGE